MNVTFCTLDRPNYVGGPNVWLRRLLPALRQRGIESRVLFLLPHRERSAHTYPTLATLRHQGFDCHAIRKPYYTEQQLRWVLRKLAEAPPDIFIPSMTLAGWYAVRWMREAGIPTIGLLRGEDPLHLAILDQFVAGDPADSLSALVCVSRYLEQLAQRHNPNNVVIARMPSAVTIPDAIAQAPQEQLRLMYVGRLVEVQKRISDVTHALCQVVDEVPGTAANIYGEGNARPAVERLLHSHGQGLPIQLVGQVDSSAIQDHMLQHHVIVLLSDYEGLSVAVMEAMACGLVPVCLQMRTGFDELIEHDVTGLVVHDRGESFVAAVRRLREEPGLWERLSRAARTRVEQEFSMQVVADRWINLMHSLRVSAGPQRPIVVPKKVQLPPAHPNVAHSDYRQPPMHRVPFAFARRAAGSVKYRLLHHAVRQMQGN